MKRINRYFRWGWVAWAVLLLLLVSACSKEINIPNDKMGSPGIDIDYDDFAIGTLRSRDGIRYIRVDESSVGMIVNPEIVEDYPDGTRMYIRYRCVVIGSAIPDFCTDAILVEWVSSLDMGEVSLDRQAGQGDPLTVLKNWMTTLEDGFLTVSYATPQDRETIHKFCLCPGERKNEFRLIHDANGDIDGKPYTGLVCFYVAPLLPDTGGETVTLSLTYLELDYTTKTLTFDYRSPQ